MRKIISIKGMGCQNCVHHVTEALKNLDGVTSAKVSLENNNAVVELNNDIADEAFISVIDEAGYDVVKIEKA